jgi:hypothetical protein
MEDDLTSSPSPMCANVNNLYPLTPSMNLNIPSPFLVQFHSTELVGLQCALMHTGSRNWREGEVEGTMRRVGRVSLVITANLRLY